MPHSERIIKAGVARIAEESRHGVSMPDLESAPLLHGVDDSGLGLEKAASNAPPEGYSFVIHHGEMAKARMDGEAVDKQTDDRGPDWLESPDAIAGLTRQAAAAGRGWSFGWIRLVADATIADVARDIDGTGAEIVGNSGRMIRARLPGDPSSLKAISGLDAVEAIGATPPKPKLASFEDLPIFRGPDGLTPVYVTLMTGRLPPNSRSCCIPSASGWPVYSDALACSCATQTATTSTSSPVRLSIGWSAPRFTTGSPSGPTPAGRH